jgi:hypothetical protein
LFERDADLNNVRGGALSVAFVARLRRRRERMRRALLCEAAPASVGVEHGRQLTALGDEPDGEGVDAVARVLVGEALALEDVAEVAAAVGADYFRAPAVRVRVALDAPRVLFVETRPAAARLELGLGRVEWVVAAPADEGAG